MVCKERSSPHVGIDPEAPRDTGSLGITSWESRHRHVASSWGQNGMELCYLQHLLQFSNNGGYLQVLWKCQLCDLHFTTEWREDRTHVSYHPSPLCFWRLLCSGQPTLSSSSPLPAPLFEPVPIRFSSQPFIPLSLPLTRITCDSKMLSPIIDLTYHADCSVLHEAFSLIVLVALSWSPWPSY